MGPGRLRSYVAAIGVAAVLAHGLTGHVPQLDHEGVSEAAAGLCLLVAAVVGFAALRPPDSRHPVVWRAHSPAVALLPVRLDRKARASPAVLQRFRN